MLADSVAEFSGTQGQDDWTYGYYDVRDDVENGNGSYDPGDMIPFLNDGSGVVSADPAIGGWKTSPNHWNGGQVGSAGQRRCPEARSLDRGDQYGRASGRQWSGRS